jgi:hypothetical protein
MPLTALLNDCFAAKRGFPTPDPEVRLTSIRKLCNCIRCSWRRLGGRGVPEPSRGASRVGNAPTRRGRLGRALPAVEDATAVGLNHHGKFLRAIHSDAEEGVKCRPLSDWYSRMARAEPVVPGLTRIKASAHGDMANNRLPRGFQTLRISKPNGLWGQCGAATPGRRSTPRGALRRRKARASLQFAFCATAAGGWAGCDERASLVMLSSQCHKKPARGSLDAPPRPMATTGRLCPAAARIRGPQ